MVADVVRRSGALSLGSRLKRIGERLQAETQEVMAAHGVDAPPSLQPLLVALDEEGPLTIGELAQALGVAQPGVTRSVRDLTGRGLVASTIDPSDQRRRVVTLTPEGKALVDRGRAEIWLRIVHCVRDALGPEADAFLAQLDQFEDALNDRSFLQRLKDFETSKGEQDDDR